MNIEANKRRRNGLGVAVGVMVAWTTWLAAVPGPDTGHSFTPASIASPFTQDLYATTGNLPTGAILGGVAFSPDGRVWSAECSFLGTRLHRFASTTTAVNGSSVHDEELVVDLTATGPLGFAAGGCGLVNHPDGSMYSSSKTGIWQLNATTGQPVAGPFGHAANSLGIAVDPQPGHHLVYVGNDCHPSLDPVGRTCTLWDLDPVTHTSLVFARLTRAELMLIDGLYFDPSGNFLFAAHRQVDIDDVTGVRSDHNSLQIIRRPAALLPVNAPIDDTQSLPVVPMVSEPDGVAFHAADGFVVTLNESGDCLNGSNQVVGSNPTTHLCAVGTTPIGGTMTRFDFPGADYTQVATKSTFAYGGFRGDLMQVGPDGCIYATQAPLAASGGSLGTRYDNDVTSSDNSLVQICGGFVLPPGVTREETGTGSIAGLVFLDTNDNGLLDSGEGGLANVLVTLSTDPLNPVSSAADGTFKFEQLTAGTYMVTTPATATYAGGSIGLSTAGSSGALNLAAGEQKTGLEFGYAPGSIAGTVFIDLNHNQVLDMAEPHLGSVTLTLSGSAGGTAISAVDGSYTFNLLASATYTVTVPDTVGTLILTTVGARNVALALRENKTGVDFGYAPPLAIACVSPATGQVGVPYSGIAVASGGLLPYTYAIVGTLPAGLTLNPSAGDINGTPTAIGSFSVSVTDANGAFSAGNACSVTIAPASLAHLTLVKVVTNDNGGTAVAANFTLSATGPTPIAGTGGVSQDVMPGNYALSETTLPGYAAGAWSCMGGAQSGNTIALLAGQSAACSITNNDLPPGLTIVKTVDDSTVVPFQQVTYSYTVTNTGAATLTNVVVTDDNGTPTYVSDDFVVGTIPSLAPGASVTLGAQVIPVVSTVATVNGNPVNAGAVIVVVPQANGDIRVTYIQDFGINDNTHGTGAIGWSNGHTFSNLTGSDKLEFRFFDKNGAVVLDFYQDSISASTQFPSGYGSLCASGGDGSMVSGNITNIVTCTTSLATSLNSPANLPNKAALIVNSPTTLVGGNVVVDPVKAPGGWDYINRYSVIIKASTFGTAGFGSVMVPDQHNSPSKLGVNQIATTPGASTVTNIASAVTASAGGLTATASATVHIVVPPTGGGGACTVAVAAETFDKKEVKITIANNGSASIVLSAVTLTWPSANGNLMKIMLDGDVVYDNPDIPPPSANLTASQLAADPRKRTIAKGSSDVFHFVFQNNVNKAASAYSNGLLTFGSACTVGIP